MSLVATKLRTHELADAYDVTEDTLDELAAVLSQHGSLTHVRAVRPRQEEGLAPFLVWWEGDYGDRAPVGSVLVLTSDSVEVYNKRCNVLREWDVVPDRDLGRLDGVQTLVGHLLRNDPGVTLAEAAATAQTATT